MWTPTTRRQHSRAGLRYDTDLTDAEWALVEPYMPPPCACGRPREWPLREVLNAIFYVLRGGIARRLLPSDLPPKSTAFRWFSAWRDGSRAQLQTSSGIHRIEVRSSSRCVRSSEGVIQSASYPWLRAPTISSR